ncbi:MAG: cell division ATP-binding protein FtsE [Calditrichaeota bacterium]|nr:cell division ATP-binding protein FtsE [Calditrichota bacterium]
MIHFYNTTVKYAGRVGIRNINMSIAKGEFVYLTGPSGAGKSTLMKCIYMEEFPDSGNVVVAEFDSSQIKKKHIPLLRRKVGIVFQDFKLLTDRSIYDNLAFVLRVTGNRPNQIKKKVLKALGDVGLDGKEDRYPHELSGGEQQRVAIARAIINEPYILLADEPTGNLDPEVTAEIIDLLMKINKRGTAILMATHEYDIIEKNPQRVIEIRDGELVQ